MHEVSLAQSLLEIVGEYARREGFTRVRSLRLSCGRLSCVAPEALRFAFSVQAQGTKAEGAQLTFDIRPAVLYCLACGQTASSDAFDPCCPLCGSDTVLLTGGTEELKLLELDVE